jgi:hypothetical protein
MRSAPEKRRTRAVRDVLAVAGHENISFLVLAVDMNRGMQ